MLDDAGNVQSLTVFGGEADWLDQSYAMRKPSAVNRLSPTKATACNCTCAVMSTPACLCLCGALASAQRCLSHLDAACFGTLTG